MRRIRSLDGLRGIAILMVLAVHLDLFGAVPGGMPVRNVFWSGWSGVDLFFVLSGFLITGILLDSRGRPAFFSGFYRRRALRIFPLYYAVCGILFSIRAILPEAPSLKGWFSYGLFLQNWYMPHFEKQQHFLGHLWSLGVEEQFYLIWPACVFALPRRWLKAVCLAALPACLLLRIFMETRHPGFSLMNTVTRMDTLLVGAFCAVVVRETALAKQIRPWLPMTAVLAIAGILAIDFAAGEIRTRAFWTSTFGFTCFGFLYGCAVLTAYWGDGLRGLPDRLLSNPILRRFGKYSYGLYVFHIPVFFAGRALMGAGRPGVPYCVALVGVSFALAMVSFELFEERFVTLGWRRETHTFHVLPPPVVWRTSTARYEGSASHSAATWAGTEADASLPLRP